MIVQTNNVQVDCWVATRLLYLHVCAYDGIHLHVCIGRTPSPQIRLARLTHSQDNRGTKAHFVVVQIPVEYLPWATLTLTFVMAGGGAALVQGMGIVAAHLYDFLTRLYPTFQGGRNWIQTPVVIKRAFGAERTSFSHKRYGTSVRPGQTLPQQPLSNRGWTSGFSGSWGGRGQGRRLGSD
jgi:hypothetical protein